MPTLVDISAAQYIDVFDKMSLTFEMLDNAPETVTMSSNQHPFSIFDLGDNLFIPEGQSPGDGVLETLTAGELVLRQVGITPVLQQKRKSMLPIEF